MNRFAELIGQELASTILRKNIRDGRTAHAYVFTGPEGAGKMTTALAFAAALNCENPDSTGDACGQCISCHMMAGAGHPEVETIPPDGAQTKIDQMRKMLHSARYAPVRGKRRVVIVEQADTLNEDSSNSILKILEEPPSYLVIILLARNSALLLPTIRSRCLAVRFSYVPTEELSRALIDRFHASEEEAEFLAAYSEGRPGIAISLLGNEAFLDWRRRVVDLAGRILSSDLREALRLSEELQDLSKAAKDKGVTLTPIRANAFVSGDLSKADKEKGATQRAAVRTTLSALVAYYQDLLSLSVRGESAVIINKDVRDLLASQSPRQDRISSSIETLLWARRAIEGNANVQLLSDVLVMKLMR